MRAALLAILTCGCARALGPIAYSGGDPKDSKFGNGQTFAEWEIDCDTVPVAKHEHWSGSRLDIRDMYAQSCHLHGELLPFLVIGRFELPSDGRDRWPSYADALRVRARAMDCEGLAFFRGGPRVEPDGTLVGGLCVTAAAATPDPDVLPAKDAPCKETKDCAEGLSCKKGFCE